jgi:hypothetical protein
MVSFEVYDQRQNPVMDSGGIGAENSTPDVPLPYVWRLKLCPTQALLAGLSCNRSFFFRSTFKKFLSPVVELRIPN